MTLFEKIITTISYLKQPAKRRMIQIASAFDGQTGIEVGGPSAFFSFKNAFPVYLYAKKIDGVNFSNNTLWEGKIEEGNLYTYYKNKKGFQFVQLKPFFVLCYRELHQLHLTTFSKRIMLINSQPQHFFR